MGFNVRPAIAALLVLPVAACGEDEPAAPVALQQGDACGEAYFWAATARGDVAVTVTVEARERSRSEPTGIDFTLPDPDVVVRVLEGENLPRNFCTDLVDGASEPREEQGAVEGSGEITLGPAGDLRDFESCGTVAGKLSLTGLVADDGTSFAPITVRSSAIGCYAG